jgi:hypothetical protein
VGRQVAICIGVKRSGKLPELPGAAAGAAEFAQWARTAGFVVREFTDADGEPVRASRIFDAISAEVEKMDVERLVVYFAGHGVSKGTSVDYWLLSQAPANPNEVIDVASSVRNARRCGVPHVVVIGDACRTMADTNHMGVGGYVLFADNQATDADLDQFFGAVSGDPSYELATDDEKLSAYGIFSECLMRALRGEVPAATEVVEGGAAPRAVTSWALRDYLLNEVPVRAGRRGLKQRPDCIPGSRWPPNVLAWVTGAGAVSAGRGRGGGGGGGGRRTRGILGDPSDALDLAPEPGSESFLPRPALEDEDIRAAASELAAHQGRDHFESGSGLTIVGATPKSVAVTGGDYGLFEESGLWHVTGPGPATSAVIDLGDGRYVATALLPQFLGTVHVGSSGVDLVTYRGAPGTRYAGDDVETTEALALMGAAFRAGFHDLAIDEAVSIGDTFRHDKHRNPTYGVIAAYAYDRAGRADEIRDMIGYFLEAEQTVPYDLPLLAFVDPSDLPGPCAPSFPLMTQGWAYLDLDAVPPVIARARESLAPSTWATATGTAGKALFDSVARGDL